MGTIQPWHIILLFLVVIVIAAVAAAILVAVRAGRAKPLRPHGPRPAGWYPAPDNPSVLRWFDGQRWTQHTSATNGPSPSGGPSPR